MNKEYIIKDIKEQFSLMDEAFREYEELSNAGEGDEAMSRVKFLSASLNCTLKRFAEISEGWGLEGMTPMLRTYLGNYSKYNEIVKDIANGSYEVENEY